MTQLIPEYESVKGAKEILRKACLAAVKDEKAFIPQIFKVLDKDIWPANKNKYEELSKFIHDKTTTPRGSEKKMPNLWDAMRIIAPDILGGQILKQRSEEFANGGNLLASAIGQALALDYSNAASALDFIQGTHRIYRYSHLGDDEVMILRCQCGVNGDPTRFQIDGVYHGATGDDVPDHVEGTIIPFGNGYILFGKMDGPFLPGGPPPSLYMLAIDRLVGTKMEVRELHGMITVSVGGNATTAFPCWGQVCVEDFKPSWARTDDLGADQELWDRTIKKALNRGRVVFNDSWLKKDR